LGFIFFGDVGVWGLFFVCFVFCECVLCFVFGVCVFVCVGCVVCALSFSYLQLNHWFDRQYNFHLFVFGVPGKSVRLQRFWGPKSRAKEHDTDRNLTRYRVGGV